MEFNDNLVIGQLEEGTRYAITDGGNHYSDGVWITKTGDEIKVRNFWDKDNNHEYYRYDEEDNVCYPKDNTDQIIVVHKDLLTFIPDCASFIFEEMSLIEFYENVIVHGLEIFKENNYLVPKQIKGKLKFYDSDFNLIKSI